jgi:integrase
VRRLERIRMAEAAATGAFLVAILGLATAGLLVVRGLPRGEGGTEVARSLARVWACSDFAAEACLRDEALLPWLCKAGRLHATATEEGLERELADLHFHDSRAEAIFRLSKRLDVLELARMVGHRDPRSLMLYYATTADELADKLG